MSARSMYREPDLRGPGANRDWEADYAQDRYHRRAHGGSGGPADRGGRYGLRGRHAAGGQSPARGIARRGREPAHAGYEGGHAQVRESIEGGTAAQTKQEGQDVPQGTARERETARRDDPG